MDALRIVRWWLLFLSYGILVLPACWLLFRRFADKGYSFARIIGYVLVAYLMFASSVVHLLKFSYISIIICAALIALCEAIIFLRRRDLAQEMLAWFRSPTFWRYAIFEELLFLALLAFWSYLRACVPDLNSLEKYMNLGFINSMLNTDFMPAVDMWFAGENINYYYFGHFCAAVATRLSGLPSDVAYNLMMATLFSATFCAVFSLSHALLSLRRKGKKLFSVIGGLVSSVMVCLSGNLHYFVYHTAATILFKLNLVDEVKAYWFADATRYIGYQPPVENDLTITEFPLYSYIVSDLHAHVMNVLPVILFLGVALCFVLSRREKTAEEPSLRALFVPSPHLVAMGILIGFFSMTNFWDYPIYMVVSLFLFVYTGWCSYGFGKKFWISTLYYMVLLYILNTVISLPFTYGFKAMFSGIGIVSQRSRFYQLMVLWGGQLLIGAVFALWLFLCNKGRDSAGNKDAIPSKFSLANFEVPDIFVLILFICGFGLAFGTEFVYVRDIYEESFPRANTMFKLSYQAFILFGIGMGYVFARLVDRKRRLWKTLLCGTLISCVLLCLISYAGNAIPTWYGKLGEDRYESLDGLGFLEEISTATINGKTVYPAADSVQWIRENTPKDAVVLEVYGDSYSERCFVSIATGRATIVGWQTHEWLWNND
ncbi:MAG: hypothetical protein IKL89_01640 [Clostridia bacterium]|nr:hypothetical protein [Clostridia bacterium]